jgi:ArsR family transcriptional regulator
MDQENNKHVAALCAALHSSARWDILEVLATYDGTKNVDELIAALDERGYALEQPTVSHHLSALRSLGFLALERRGLYNYYSVVSAPLIELGQALCSLAELADQASKEATAA